MKAMKTLRTLVQLTTTATLAASLLNTGGAFAARIASNSTTNGYSTDNSQNSTQSRVARQTSADSKVENRAKKYEPTPNGNPATNDGTGTR
ncbi:MAG: hypothetical protein MUE44_17270 [Oscillatoriaceae cyanobacterium Prado104]|jgi:hypothetical protein|nr:hypothetical protein [Oscillatoriaceae cyanobacterium Prado104]